MPHSLNPNVLNQSGYTKLRNNIEKTGIYPALIVRKIPDEKYQIIDGYHRYLILQELKYKEAHCQVIDISDQQVLVLLATLNRLRGSDEIEKRAKIIQTLVSQDEDLSFLDLLPESAEALSLLASVVDKDIATIKDERGYIEEQLLQAGIEPDRAEKMSKLHVPPSEKLYVKFVFSSEEEYNKVVKYFGIPPQINKLLKLIDGK